MKNIYKIFIAAIMVTGLWSCESEDNFMLVEAPAAAFTFITPDSGTSIILHEDTPANTAVTFTWEEVDYGTPTVVSYTLQFAANGTEFAAPIEVTTSTNAFYSMSVTDLNAQALLLGVVPFNAETNEGGGLIDVRIMSSVGTTGSEPKYSDVISLMLYPYSTLVPKRELYLVGSAVAAGWNPDNGNNPMFRDPADEDKYYYTGYFAAGEFKLLETNAWAPMFGTDGTNLVARPTESDPDPASFAIAASGWYTFNVNIADLSYTLLPYAGDTSVTFGTIGIIGSGTAGGWDASTAMEQSAFDPHIWKVTAAITNGEMKFRADNDWAANWGSDTALSGQGTQNGANIPVAAGSYEIWFNDVDGRYLMIPIL